MIDEQRINSVRQRVRDHQAKEQQLQGKRETLEEQHSNYVTELAKAGLTPEELPAHMEQLQQTIESTLTQLEQVLDAVDA